MPGLAFARSCRGLQAEIFRPFQVIEDLTDDPPDEGHVALLQLPPRCVSLGAREGRERDSASRDFQEFSPSDFHWVLPRSGPW